MFHFVFRENEMETGSDRDSDIVEAPTLNLKNATAQWKLIFFL